MVLIFILLYLKNSLTCQANGLRTGMFDVLDAVFGEAYEDFKEVFREQDTLLLLCVALGVIARRLGSSKRGATLQLHHYCSKQ